jgi:archaellin
MKATFLFLLITPFVMAQSIFDTYQSDDRVTYVSISPQMFSMLTKLNIDISDPDAKEFYELVTQIKTFKLLRTDDPSVSTAFSGWAQDYVKENQLTELMQIQEDEATVYFYALLSDQDDVVDELIMLVKKGELESDHLEIVPQTVVLLIQGSIDLQRIASLTKKLDLPAGDELKKLKNQVRI